MSLTHSTGPLRAYCRDVNYVEGQIWPEDEFLQWEVEGFRVPNGRGEFFQGDALLVAASLDLLNLAREFEAFAEAAMDDAIEEGDAMTATTWRTRRDNARRVIAKATGSAT